MTMVEGWYWQKNVVDLHLPTAALFASFRGCWRFGGGVSLMILLLLVAVPIPFVDFQLLVGVARPLP